MVSARLSLLWFSRLQFKSLPGVNAGESRTRSTVKLVWTVNSPHLWVSFWTTSENNFSYRFWHLSTTGFDHDIGQCGNSYRPSKHTIYSISGIKGKWWRIYRVHTLLIDKLGPNMAFLWKFRGNGTILRQSLVVITIVPKFDLGLVACHLYIVLLALKITSIFYYVHIRRTTGQIKTPFNLAP